MRNIKQTIDITIDDLDINNVYDIAKGELAHIADEKMNPFDTPRASAPLADWYLDLYFDDAAMFVGSILDTISEKLDDDDDIEKVLGEATARAARLHAVADIDLMGDDFAERAMILAPDELLIEIDD